MEFKTDGLANLFIPILEPLLLHRGAPEQQEALTEVAVLGIFPVWFALFEGVLSFLVGAVAEVQDYI